MPLANPDSSFEAAVRHLFRHLADAKELRRNPLVKRFFERRGSDDAVGDSIALDAIRSRVEALAKNYCDDAAAAERFRAKRHFAVLAAGLHGHSVKAIAQALQISLRQCYRERSAIHRYVGEILRQSDDESAEPVLEIRDVFETQMERAAARIENGDYSLAMRQYAGIVNDGTAGQRLRALAALAAVELELGRTAVAEASLEDLSALLSRTNRIGRVDLAEGSACIRLLQARLAWEKGAFAETVARLASTRIDSERLKCDPADRLRAVYADIVLESAIRAFDLGDFDSVKVLLAEATCVSDTLPVPHRRKAALMLIASNLAFADAGPGPRNDPMELASRSRSMAVQCGSIKWRLKAEMFLTALQRSHVDVANRGELILRNARDLRNPALTAVLSLELADLLLETAAWRNADRLLSVALPRENFYTGSFRMLKAVYHLKARSPRAASRHARAAHSIASRAGTPRFQAAALRLLGYASYLLGERDKADDYISSAVPLAERYGSAPARLKTLRIAALITGKRRYAREAAMLASFVRDAQ